MARAIIYAMIVLVFMELTLFLFGGGTGGLECNYNESTQEYTATNGTVAQSSLFYTVYCPNTDITKVSWFVKLRLALLAIGATSLILGTFYSLNVYGIYAGLSAVFLSFAMSYYNWYVFMEGALDGIVTPGIARILSMATTAALLIPYIFVVLEYTRSGN